MKALAKQIKETIKRDAIYKKKTATVKTNESLTILARIPERWNWTKEKQQQNTTCVLVFHAYNNNYITSDIALEIFWFTFHSVLFDKGKHSNDKNYNNISRRLWEWKKHLDNGALDEIPSHEGK